MEYQFNLPMRYHYEITFTWMPCKNGSEGSFKKFQENFLALIESLFSLFICSFSHQISIKGLSLLYYYYSDTLLETKMRVRLRLFFDECSVYFEW